MKKKPDIYKHVSNIQDILDDLQYHLRESRLNNKVDAKIYLNGIVKHLEDIRKESLTAIKKIKAVTQ